MLPQQVQNSSPVAITGLTLSYMRKHAPGNGNRAAILDLLRQAGLPE